MSFTASLSSEPALGGSRLDMKDVFVGSESECMLSEQLTLNTEE